VEARLVSVPDTADVARVKALFDFTDEESDRLFVCEVFQGVAFELLESSKTWWVAFANSLAELTSQQVIIARNVADNLSP
jgi:hypothetical protein